MSDPIEPDDPDVRFHAAWLAQLSEGADGLVSKQVSKHDGCNTSEAATLRHLGQGPQLSEAQFSEVIP